VIGRTCARDRLVPELVDAMLALMQRHFAGVSRERFEADLADKDQVVLVTDQHDRLVGFSSFSLQQVRLGGRELDVVYSGDTIMDPAAWRTPVLAATWIGAVLAEHRRRCTGRLYWLLLVSGFRTYRFLPVFWRELWPCYRQPTPPEMQRLMHHLARVRYGDAYDAASGVVRFAEPQCLAPHLAGIPQGRLADPHVAHFVRLNPGHAAGDELVCLTEITDENLTRAGRRMVRRSGAYQVEDRTIGDGR